MKNRQQFWNLVDLITPVKMAALHKRCPIAPVDISHRPKTFFQFSFFLFFVFVKMNSDVSFNLLYTYSRLEG